MFAAGRNRSHRKTILLEGAYRPLTSSARCKLVVGGLSYPTAEHLYKANYFSRNPILAKQIRECPSARDAYVMAEKFRGQMDPGLPRESIPLMEKVIAEKIRQNKPIAKMLIGTGDARLVHHSRFKFWGDGLDGTGQNNLGKLLERQRNKLKQGYRLARNVSFGSKPVYFGHGKQHPFTNDAHYQVTYHGRRYSTCEHLFQALKFTDHRIAEKIRRCATSREALDTGRAHRGEQRPDWDQVKKLMMREALWLKFSQHEDLARMLLGTGDAPLIYWSHDAYWGNGQNGQGRNEFGNALQWVRNMLKQRNSHHVGSPLNGAMVPTKGLGTRFGFYDKHKPGYNFTNFAEGFPFNFLGLVWPTSEHPFQAFKFLLKRPDLFDKIRRMPNARLAFQAAQSKEYLPWIDPRWHEFKIEMMYIIVRVKFMDPRLAKELLATGDAELVEDSPVDAFWGVGKDRKGRNELGKCLMRVRSELRREIRKIGHQNPFTHQRFQYSIET